MTNEREEAEPPDLPVLSKDAWELVQYRMWDQLRSKMWTTLTVFLTLVTIGGLLGIPAYISSRVDQKIADERAKFDELRLELDSQRLSAVSRSDMAACATIAWSQDLARFQLHLIRVSSALDNADNIESSVRNVVRLLIGRLGRFELGPDDFRSEVRMLTDVLRNGQLPESNDYSDEPLTENDWAAFRGASGIGGFGALPELYELYSHVLALKTAMLIGYESAIAPALSEPMRRAKLYEQYSVSLFPAYEQSLAAVYGGSRPTWLRGGSDWTWLPESAVSVFGEQEERTNSADGGAENN